MTVLSPKYVVIYRLVLSRQFHVQVLWQSMTCVFSPFSVIFCGFLNLPFCRILMVVVLVVSSFLPTVPLMCLKYYYENTETCILLWSESMHFSTQTLRPHTKQECYVQTSCCVWLGCSNPYRSCILIEHRLENTLHKDDRLFCGKILDSFEPSLILLWLNGLPLNMILLMDNLTHSIYSGVPILGRAGTTWGKTQTGHYDTNT